MKFEILACFGTEFRLYFWWTILPLITALKIFRQCFLDYLSWIRLVEVFKRWNAILTDLIAYYIWILGVRCIIFGLMDCLLGIKSTTLLWVDSSSILFENLEPFFHSFRRLIKWDLVQICWTLRPQRSFKCTIDLGTITVGFSCREALVILHKFLIWKTL